MATKCIVIGEKEKGSKKIELVKLLSTALEFREVNISPSQWHHLELISKNYSDGFDLIFAYRSDRNGEDATLYLGHWNDAIV